MPLTVSKNVSLAELTTLKIGGAARFFARATEEGDVAEAFRFAREKDLQIFILGGGSNVLIADEGFDGLVLQIALKGISIVDGDGETVFVTARAGEDWDEFCKFCVEKNLAGVECLSGIPGFTGGTPVQNVGAYGQEVSETIFAVRVFDRKSFSIFEMTNADCNFAYRSSIFNTTARNRFVVLAVTFALKSGGAPKIVYQDLREFFGGGRPTLSETRDAVLKIRRVKSMVIDARDANTKSAGSFFKNPTVGMSEFSEIESRARFLGLIAENETIPTFAMGEKRVKIPAAWLIERSGFSKGFVFGRVGLSTNHTLAIVNRGGAAAADVLNLKEEIQSKVKENFEIELKPEPVFVGFYEIAEKNPQKESAKKK